MEEIIEIWKPVLGFENSFIVSNNGRVKRLTRTVFMDNGSKRNSHYRELPEIILNGSITKFGYHRIKISEQRKTRLCFIHRMVAESFIPNPENKPQVNHINGIKHDNRVENLEWCTQLENMSHAVKTGLKVVSYDTKRKLHEGRLKVWDNPDFIQKNTRKVINTLTNDIYPSVPHAARSIGVSKDILRSYLKTLYTGGKPRRSFPFKFYEP